MFSADGGERPLDQTGIRRTRYNACVGVGISREAQAARGLCFHSWRRFANTIFRARGIPDPIVRQVTGHESAAMTEHYSAFALEHFAPVVAVQEDLFAGKPAGRE